MKLSYTPRRHRCAWRDCRALLRDPGIKDQSRFIAGAPTESSRRRAQPAQTVGAPGWGARRACANGRRPPAGARRAYVNGRRPPGWGSASLRKRSRRVWGSSEARRGLNPRLHLLVECRLCPKKKLLCLVKTLESSCTGAFRPEKIRFNITTHPLNDDNFQNYPFRSRISRITPTSPLGKSALTAPKLASTLSRCEADGVV